MGYYDLGQGSYILRKHFDDNTDQSTHIQLIFPGGICRFSYIPPGRFIMGSPLSEFGREQAKLPFGREPCHEVIISKGFWLCITACDQKLWRAVMANNPSYFKHDDKPIENVNWHDVCLFIERLNGLNNKLNARLPSEAEWEYACRAGTSTPFSLGSSESGDAFIGRTITSQQANYDATYLYPNGRKGEARQQTVEVRCFLPNTWGLYQMHGNVWEWCEDAWDEHLTTSQVRDPRANSFGRDTKRVLRGGSWKDSPDLLRSAARGSSFPELRSSCIGFRLALDNV